MHPQPVQEEDQKWNQVEFIFKQVSWSPYYYRSSPPLPSDAAAPVVVSRRHLFPSWAGHSIAVVVVAADADATVGGDAGGRGSGAGAAATWSS